MWNKQLFALILAVILSTVVSVPADFLDEIAEEFQIQGFYGHDGCDPTYTCSYKCPCGERIFYDLRTFPNWSVIRKVWKKKVCKRINLKKWLERQVNIYTQQVDKVGLRHAFRNTMLKKFKKIVSKYKKICKDDNVKVQLSQGIRSVSFFLRNAFYFLASIKHGKKYRSLAKQRADDVFKLFKKKAKKNEFRFCRCVKFERFLTSSQKTHFQNEVNDLCNEKCGNQ
eukprot:gene6930-11093_t